MLEHWCKDLLVFRRGTQVGWSNMLPQPAFSKLTCICCICSILLLPKRIHFCSFSFFASDHSLCCVKKLLQKPFSFFSVLLCMTAANWRMTVDNLCKWKLNDINTLKIKAIGQMLIPLSVDVYMWNTCLVHPWLDGICYLSWKSISLINFKGCSTFPEDKWVVIV